MSYRVGFVSLGCAKNQVDCEQMMFLLRQAGVFACRLKRIAGLLLHNTLSKGKRLG